MLKKPLSILHLWRWHQSRRPLCVACLVFAIFAINTPNMGFSAPASAPSEVPVDELMKTGDLAEITLGPPDAKVTIVEYASMTCGHCKNFHTKVFPDLKTKFIDTGKIRFIFREFPLDTRAFAASMLARCVGEDKTMPMISVLFDTQGEIGRAHV